jgi:hypothetical protein
MTLQECHKIVNSKGGKVLEHRTEMKGLKIGNTFSMQTLTGPYEIMFFFKDKVFDHCPMVFGWCKKTNGVLMVSSKLLTIIEQNNSLIKRKRGIQ